MATEECEELSVSYSEYCCRCKLSRVYSFLYLFIFHCLDRGSRQQDQLLQSASSPVLCGDRKQVRKTPITTAYLNVFLGCIFFRILTCMCVSWVCFCSVEQDCLFRTLSAILTLGNAEFEEQPDDSGHDCAYITESYIADRVAELLGGFYVNSYSKYMFSRHLVC